MHIHNYRIIVFLLILCFAASGFTQINIAVMEFTNESDEFFLDRWQKSIPDLLKSELGKNSTLILLERKNLKSVLVEKALSQTGLTDSSHQAIGRLVNAEYIIAGSVHRVSDQYIIESSIVKVSSGQTQAEKVQCPDRNHLQAMIKILGNNIAFRLTGEGKYIRNKKIGHNPTKYFLVSGVALAVGAGISWSGHQKKYDEYHANSELEKFSDLYDQSNNLKKLAAGLASVSAAAFVVTFYSWLKYRSPKEITTAGLSHFKWIPQIQYSKNNGVLLGAKIHF